MKTSFFYFAAALCLVLSCSKSVKNSPPVPPTPPGGGDDTTITIIPPVDPPVAATMGFFLDDWRGKTFVVPDAAAANPPANAATDSVAVDVSKVITKVPNYIYGNNSVLWMGQIVDQPALMGYLKDLSPRIVRAPAGSVSDTYFWNDTTAAPADVPASLLNADGSAATAVYWYGGNTGDWTLALSNYYSMLSQTNSTGIITVNYGYARYGTSADPVATAAHLAADWVRHDAGRTKFWEVGNENYGNWEAGYRIDVSQNKDGQPELITGDLYGRHFKVFSDSMHAAAVQIGATIYVGATLVESTPYQGAYTSLVTWDQGVLTQAGSKADFFVVHSYFTPYGANSPAGDILNTSTTVPASIRSYVLQQLSTYGVSPKPIALTEWNIQAIGSKQEVSYVAGMHAAKTLGAIIQNQFGEASRWDLANGWGNGDDMGLFNDSKGDAEPGAPIWNPRPSFFYLYYFQKFFGDRMVSATLSGSSDLTSYASSFSSGETGVVLINSGTTNRILSIKIKNFLTGTNYYWYTLTGGTDNGAFSGQVYVNGTGPSSATGGPSTYATLKANTAAASGTLKVAVPAMGVVYLVVDKK